MKQQLGDRVLNEADTRFRLIDTVFFECLGWPKTAVNMEQRINGTYADYTFSTNARVAILEAKREGINFELPIDTGAGTLNLRTVTTGAGVEDAIRQVMTYCQQRGVPIGIVSNGHQMIAFVAARSDGVAPLEGRAVVYPSLADVASRWTEFWNFFSPAAMKSSTLQSELLGIRAPSLPGKLSTTILGYPGIKNRNLFQTDLQVVAELVIEDVARARELESEFLEDCYCKSGSLSQYSLLSKNVLRARYAALESGAQLTSQPAVTKQGVSGDLLATSIKKRPTLLIGDVGVGKTMFIRHLIKVDAKEILDQGITLYVDLGSQATLTDDLRDFIPREMARQLNDDYGVDIQERSFVSAVYHPELLALESSIFSELKESDPAKYAAKRIEVLAELTTRPSEHLARSLDHIAKGRRKQIVLFLDNVDQRDSATQQQAFLIAHEVSSNWPVTVFLALRPATFHRSLRNGALTGYHPKAFTISPPRIVDVISKRLDFALRLARGELPISGLDAGVELTKLSKIMEAFTYSLQANRNLACCIDNIAAGNVRVALEQVRDFFGSGHVDTQKILEIMDKQGSYLVPVHEFLRATLYGDAVHYDPSQSVVPNLFDVTEPDKREHFLVPVLLGFVQNWGRIRGGDEAVESTRVIEALQDFGYTPSQVLSAVRRCLSGNLVDSAAEIESPAGELPSSVRITSLGAYALQYLCRQFTYVDAVTVDTPVMDVEWRLRLADEKSIASRLDRALVFVDYLDSCWASMQAGVEDIFDWGGVSTHLKSEIEAIRNRAVVRAAAVDSRGPEKDGDSRTPAST